MHLLLQISLLLAGSWVVLCNWPCLIESLVWWGWRGAWFNAPIIWNINLSISANYVTDTWALFHLVNSWHESLARGWHDRHLGTVTTRHGAFELEGDIIRVTWILHGDALPWQTVGVTFNVCVMRCDVKIIIFWFICTIFTLHSTQYVLCIVLWSRDWLHAVFHLNLILHTSEAYFGSERYFE